MYEGLPMTEPMVRNAWYEKDKSIKAMSNELRFKHLVNANSCLVAGGYTPPEEDIHLALHYFLAMKVETI